MNKLTEFSKKKPSKQTEDNFLSRAAASEEKNEPEDNANEELGEYQLQEHLHVKNRKPQPGILEHHLSEAEKVEGRFNGNVEYNGEQIKVRGGFANFEGEIFMVSDDGRIVADKDHHFIGTIQDGKFIPATPEIIHQFQQEGLLGNANEQPKGSTTQA